MSALQHFGRLQYQFQYKVNIFVTFGIVALEKSKLFSRSICWKFKEEQQWKPHGL